MSLAHVSSRELNGKVCEWYTRSQVHYSNTASDKITKVEGIDAWVMALPNGVCKPFVENLLANKQNATPLILDLSADYRFDRTWTYGLPELYKSRDVLKKAKLISNPGI